MFLYQNMDVPESDESEFSLSRVFMNPGISKFDLSLEILSELKSMKYAFEYSTELFKPATIQRLADYFKNLVEAVLKNPAVSICDLMLLSNDEYQEFVYDFNDTKEVWPDLTTVALFQKQVEKTPNAIAVREDGRGITYKQLNDKANQLAGQLNSRGIGKDDIVGLCLPASIELIIGILGVLKAGSCYLPIDTDLPGERQQYLAADSKCSLILIDESQTKTSFQQNEVFIINELTNGEYNDSKRLNKVVPEDLAYVIYTSGTTGKPKGVKITHKSLVNYLLWGAKEYIQGEKTAFPLYSSISFDLTITSIFLPLVTGNELVIYPETAVGLSVENVFRRDEVDLVKLTPSHLRLLLKHNLLKENSRITKLIVGGEKLETSLAEDIYRKMGKKVAIFNEYGPTEATVGCMIHQFSPGEEYPNVPIGVPAANTQIYLLDDFLVPVPVNVPGEIYIAGDGLSDGYLFQDLMTEKKFVDNPFQEGQKMYRTGDIAKRLSHGVLDYIGRRDSQVKLNGHRIELEEIENQLLTCPNVHQTFLMIKQIPSGEPQLYAYYTLEDADQETSNADLRNYLANRLPHYMVPVSFISVNSMPLTSNGKVDTVALSAIDSTISEEHPEASDVENLMLEVWKDVLGDRNITVSDNFFELGGDSIKAVQLSSKLYEEGIMLKVKDILTFHSIKYISPRAEKAGANQYEQGVIEGARALTPI
ncbi:MAG: amino acid adenylation domain-containing protein, partial [Bacteroidota bacterium]